MLSEMVGEFGHVANMALSLDQHDKCETALAFPHPTTAQLYELLNVAPSAPGERRLPLPAPGYFPLGGRR